MAVGIFDTGIGGLAVLAHLRSLGFENDIMYFNDDGRFPYGEKGEHERLRYALEVTRFLSDRGAKSISISCNTVVTFAREAVAKDLNIKPFDVISAALNKIKNLAPTPAKILVIGSKVTCASKIYADNLLRENKNTQVFEVPFNELIYTIERDFSKIKEADIKAVVHSTIQDLKPDVLVLACSHYSLVAHHFQSLYPHLEIIDPTFELALELFDEAAAKEDKQSEGECNKIFYTGEKEGIMEVLDQKGVNNVRIEKVNWN